MKEKNILNVLIIRRLLFNFYIYEKFFSFDTEA